MSAPTPIIQMPPRELAEYVARLSESTNPTIYAVPLLACADKLRDQAARIAALEAALREAREWIPDPPAAIRRKGCLLQAKTTLEIIDAALAQPVGGKT